MDCWVGSGEEGGLSKSHVPTFILGSITHWGPLSCPGWKPLASGTVCV